MKASELILDQLYRVPSINSHNFSLDRMLTISATALGTLRQELTETIGLDRRIFQVLLTLIWRFHKI